MNEPEVVVRVSELLNEEGSRFYVDGSTYYSDKINELPDRLENCELHDTLRIGRRIPDIIGYTDSGEIFAIEAKGDDGIRKGIGQAAYYRQGVHTSYIAAESDALDEYRSTIRSCGLGVYAVGENPGQILVEAPNENVAATELNKTRRALAVKASDFQSDQNAFSSLTMPLNSLLPVVMIETADEKAVSEEECRALLADHEHGLGKSTSSHSFALSRTLQLITRNPGNPPTFEVTDTGKMGYYLLKGKMSSISDFSMGIDQKRAPKGPRDQILHYIQDRKNDSQYRSDRVYQTAPEVASFLRDRYFSVPDVRLLAKVLSSHDGTRAELSRILTEIGMESPDVFINLFVDSRREDKFKEIIEESSFEPGDEDLQKQILGVTSPDYMYNFARQLIHVKILTNDSKVPGPEDPLEHGKYEWVWDSGIVGDIGFRTM